MTETQEAIMTTTATRYVYRFGGGVDDGGQGDRNLLGGKGANLDGMAAIGLPVPPGFTITTEMCTRYYEDGGVYPDSVKAEVATGSPISKGSPARNSATPPIRCSSRSGRARARRCPA